MVLDALLSFIVGCYIAVTSTDESLRFTLIISRLSTSSNSSKKLTCGIPKISGDKTSFLLLRAGNFFRFTSRTDDLRRGTWCFYLSMGSSIILDFIPIGSSSYRSFILLISARVPSKLSMIRKSRLLYLWLFFLDDGILNEIWRCFLLFLN